MPNKIEFKKIREFGEIINDTFSFIKQNLKPLFKVFAYLCGFFILASMISATMQQINMQHILKNPGAYPNNSPFSMLFSYQYLLLMVFGLANYTAVNVSTFSFIALYVEKGNEAPTVEEVWSYFKYYYFRALLGSVMIGIFMVVCFVCCFIPFVYVFPAMSLFFAVMILENGTLEYSFLRSFKLVKNNWGVTAATIFILWIITSATSSFTAAPGIIIGFISGLTNKAAEISTITIAITTVIQYLGQVFLVIPIIGISLCYFNLTERLDNTGLFSRIDQLGQKKAQTDNQGEY